MKLSLLPLFLLLTVTFLLTSCHSTKSIARQEPVGKLTYRLISNSHFEHLDVSYLNFPLGTSMVHDVTSLPHDYPIGLVNQGFVASISATGYTSDTGRFELQILIDGRVVAHSDVLGLNPSLAISYAVN